MAKLAKFDTTKRVEFGDITTDYIAIGSPLEFPARILTFKNKTDVGVVISDDEDNVDGVLDLISLESDRYDFTANMDTNKDDGFVYPAGTQFYVKGDSAPTGSVTISLVYAKPKQ